MHNTNNNVSNPQPVASATPSTPISYRTSLVCSALRSIGTTTTQVADFFEANPSEIHATAERTKAIGERLNELADGISAASESNAKLRASTEDAVKTSDWVNGSFPCNQAIPVYNSFNDLPHNGR